MANPKGRPRYSDRRRPLELQIPVTLAHEIELFLPRDTLTRKVRHGAWSQYFISLAREDLSRRASANDTSILTFEEEQMQ